MSYSDDFIIKDGVLEKYIGKGGDVVIPDGVTSIGEHAFYECTNLTSVIFPDGVTSISSGAFYKCINLTSVTAPDSLTSIRIGAFSECPSLTSVTRHPMKTQD